VSQRARAIGFLGRFFGPGNDIRLEGLSLDLRTWLRPWIDDLEGPGDSPVVLPRRNEGRLSWYGLEFSDSQARALGDDLVAFVGCSYSDFSGRRAQLDSNDQVERAVLELTDGHAYRFEVMPASDLIAARGALDLMRATWLRRPARTGVSFQPIGRVLRNFNMALEAGEADGSAELLEQLNARGRLTASNMAFLRIQLLAALGCWGELLALPELPTVLSVRRPVAVTDAIIRAVYRTELSRFEGDADVNEALEHFRGSVFPRYGALLKARSTMRSPEAAKMFMMLAAASVPPRLDTLQEVIAGAELSPSDRNYMDLLAQRCPIPVRDEQADPLERASTAIRVGDFDGAYRLLLAQPPGVDSLPMLLRCAYEIDSIDAAREAVSAMRAVAPALQVAVLGQRACRTWWDALNHIGEARTVAEVRRPPLGWVEWLERLDTEGPFAGALEIAASGAHEWRLADVADQPERVADLAAALLADRAPDAEAVLRNAAPHLVAFLRQADQPPASLRAVYQSAILLIAADDEIGSADLTVLLDLIGDLFAIGVSPGEYIEIVGYLEATWTAVSAPRNIDWGLDALDCLAQYPARSEAVRDKFARIVVGSMTSWVHRLEDYQASLLRALGRELGMLKVVEPLLAIRTAAATGTESDREEPALARLVGRRVGIYTLTESVGHRVRQILEGSALGVHVVVNHDPVGSDRLRHLAHDADLLLVAVRSAKHAATDYIEANRPADKPTLICAARGSAGMLRVLVDYLRSGVELSARGST
jgi:hypothetical protein